MPNGHWLITNSYSGIDKDGVKTFNGEVFEFDPDPSNRNKIVWSSPKLEWSGNDWIQKMNRSFILQQPRSGFRQL